jgi:hypothetical protein
VKPVSRYQIFFKLAPEMEAEAFIRLVFSSSPLKKGAIPVASRLHLFFPAIF